MFVTLDSCRLGYSVNFGACCLVGGSAPSSSSRTTTTRAPASNSVLLSALIADAYVPVQEFDIDQRTCREGSVFLSVKGRDVCQSTFGDKLPRQFLFEQVGSIRDFPKSSIVRMFCHALGRQAKTDPPCARMALITVSRPPADATALPTPQRTADSPSAAMALITAEEYVPMSVRVSTPRTRIWCELAISSRSPAQRPLPELRIDDGGAVH